MRWPPLLAALGLAGIAAATTAQIAYDPAAIVASERAQLIAAKQQSAQALARSVKLEAEAEAATDAADAVRKRAAALAARIQSAEADISAGEARVALIRRQLDAQRDRLAAKQQPLIELTGVLQGLSRRPPIAVLAQPGSLDDMAHMRALLTATLPVIEARTAALRAELTRLRTLRGQTATAVAALQASRTKLTNERASLSRLENERRLASRQLMSSARLEADRALGLGEKARDIVELLDTVESDSETREALARLEGPILRPANPALALTAANPAAPVSQKAGTPAYRMPVVGRIVAGLGEVSDSGARSRGLTIITRAGAQVVAPANGRIAFAGDYRGFGKIVIIDHGDGWTTLITGLIGLSTAVGDTVGAGEPLGRAGPADPRVTIELRRGGRPVDVVAMVS